MVNVLEYGAVRLPLSAPNSQFDTLVDSTAAFHRAIEAVEFFGGGVVLVPAGRWKISGLVLPSRVQLVGEGVSVTILKQAAQSATPIIATEGFATDTGTENLGQTAFAIRDMTLEGTTQSNGLANPYGGVALYGYDYELARLHFIDFNSNGLWTEWGGKLEGGNLYKKQPASFTDLTFSKNWRCGWIHLGPHDSLAARINSFGNGREHTAGGASLNNTGESNIWIARRIGPVAYLERTGIAPDYDYRISTPGSGYKPGLFAVVEAHNCIGLLGYVNVDANGKAVGIDWLYKNSNFIFAPPVPSFLTVSFLGYVPETSLPAATVALASGKIGLTTFSNFGIGLPSWPKITVKNDGTVPAAPVVAVPILRGGQIHAAIILNAGSGYSGTLTCEVIQGSNASAIGVARATSGAVTELLFGDPGCFLKSATVQNVNGANTVVATASAFGRFGEVIDWNDPIITGNAATGTRLDFVPASSTPTKLSPMGGGTLLEQSHAWGAQTYGIRVSAPAVLTGCESEGHYGANLFLEANSGTVTGAWIYDSGGLSKGGNRGAGSASAVGIQIGHAGTGDIASNPALNSYTHNSPSQWQITGRIENCHAGGVVNFAAGDAIQTDLVIANRCGIFHYGYTKLSSGTPDDAISNISPGADDLRIAAFYGEPNYFRYQRASRASIATSRFQQFNFTADTETRLDQPITKLRFYGSGRFMFDFALSTNNGFWLPPYQDATGSRGIFANSSKNGFFAADAFYFRNFPVLTADFTLTPENFVSSVRAEPELAETVITITLPLITALPTTSSPEPTALRVFNGGKGTVKVLAAVGDIVDPAIQVTGTSGRVAEVPKGSGLDLISTIIVDEGTPPVTTRAWLRR